MSTAPRSTSFTAYEVDKLRSAVADFSGDRAALQDQRKEISLLIKQTVVEIDRLAQRNRDASFQIRQLEANIDAYPKAEIQVRYTSSHEVQMRLFMMQSQLEQQRAREANLERLEKQLDRVLQVVGGLLDRAGQPAGDASLTPVPIEIAVPKERDLTAAAVQTLELIQHQLSRQLQDGPAQALTDLMLRSEVCERLLDVDGQKAKQEIAALRSAASAALKSTRQLVQELQPPLLAEQGLVPALAKYVEACKVGDELQMTLQSTGQERRLPIGGELATFRVVQEAVRNAAEHSGAARVDVKLHFGPGQVVATVVDHGRGFAVEPAVEEAKQKGYSGLAEMWRQAEGVGGTIEISSRPGAGCSVSLTFPA